jgi:hypothetical protein
MEDIKFYYNLVIFLKLFIYNKSIFNILYNIVKANCLFNFIMAKTYLVCNPEQYLVVRNKFVSF